MNPELLSLIEALDALQQCPATKITESLQLEAIYQSLVDKVLERHPNVSRQLIEATIRRAHARWLKAQAQPTIIPPKA